MKGNSNAVGANSTSSFQNFIFDKIKSIVGLRNFLRIFKNTTLIPIESNTLLINTENKAIAQIIYKDYINIIGNLLNEYWPKCNIQIKITFQNGDKTETLKEEFEYQSIQHELDNYSNKDNLIYFGEHNNNYSFDNFIESDCNIEASRICKSISCFISDEIVSAGSIILIHGDRYTGKTHLTRAMENYYKAHGGSVCYIRSCDLMKDYVNAARNGSTFDFQDKFNNYDIFILEDIDYIVNKNGTINFATNMIKKLSEMNKFIIITSSVESKKLLESITLKNTLSAAINIKIGNNDANIKKKIIVSEIVKNNYNIPLKVADLLCSSEDTSIPELKSAIKKLSIIQSIKKIEISPSLALELLSDSIIIKKKESKKEIHNEDIISKVASYYGFSNEMLISKIKKENVCKARNVAIYFLHQIKCLTYQQIGALVGNRNHSTIISAIKNVNLMIENDKSISSELADIRGKIFV